MARPDAPSSPDPQSSPQFVNDVAGIGHTLATDPRIENEREELDRGLDALHQPSKLASGSGAPPTVPDQGDGDGL